MKYLRFTLVFITLLFALSLVGCKERGENECKHLYAEEITKEPTCLKAGVKTHKCTLCGDSYDTEIDFLGHDFGDKWFMDKEPNCISDGKLKRQCSRCELAETKTVEKNGVHNVQNGYCIFCNGRESTPGLEYVKNSLDGTYMVTGIGACEETDIYIGIYNNVDVSSVYREAFKGVEQLKSVSFAPHVISIRDYAFSDCINLEKVDIPEGVKSISSYAFKGCSSLKNIYLPESLFMINNSAFSYCEALECITVNENNTNLCSIDENLYYREGNSITQNGEMVLHTYASGKKEESFTVPVGVKRILTGAFHSSNNLTTLIISDGVTDLSASCIVSCKNLTDIVLPSSLKNVSAIFGGCDKLRYNEYKGALYLGSGDNPYFVYVKRNGESIITGIHPDTRIISDLTLKNKDNISGAVIPDGVCSIDRMNFISCAWLTTFVFPKNVSVYIGAVVFSDCDNLTSVVIPKGLQYFQGPISSGCDNLSVIYCEMDEQPSTWYENWNPDGIPVVWGYTGEEVE